MEDNIQQYIAKRINKRKERIENEIDEKQANQYIGIICSGAVVITGILTTPIFSAASLVVAELALATLQLKVRNCRKLDKKEIRIKEEIKHLEEIEKGIDNKDNLRNKKAVELLSLDNPRRVAKDAYSSAKRITLLSYGLTAIGVIATALEPTYGFIVLPGLLASTLAIKNEIKKYQVCEDIKRKTNNLYHDIDVIDIEEGNVTKKEEISINKNINTNKKEYNKEKEDIDTLLEYFDVVKEDKPKQYSKSREGK